MITDIGYGLLIGDLHACTQHDGPAIHACKDPCHRRAAGSYRGALPKDHPDYLGVLKRDQLYLNMIDPPIPLFHPESFQLALTFLDNELENDRGPILIHCNRGNSRAPSIALLWLARRGIIPGRWYQQARDAFTQLYPAYDPSAGIATFLDEHWESL